MKINLALKDFTFLVLDKIFKSKTINLLDSEKNNYNFNESMVNIKTNEIIGKDVKIDFRNDIFGNSENDPRLKGNYASSNKEETIIKSGIFTTCKKNNKCPPWSLKSAEIQHDKKNQIINYKKPGYKYMINQYSIFLNSFILIQQ